MANRGLSQRTKSPQNWKRRSAIKHRRRISTRPANTPATYVGRTRARKAGKKIRKVVLILIIAGIGLGGISSIGLLAWVARDLPNPNRIIERDVAQSTKIFDRTGETVLFDIHGEEKRTVVALENIPDYILQATLIAEDRKFYEHKGISLTGIFRSILVNLRRGGRAQGGSTLTQQLIKNAILTPEKTYTRKIKEIILAYQIEKRFTKDEILQLYFNEIPYGSTAYGVEAASQTYFGKPVQKLSLAEAALIAALPKAPSYYSPYGTHVDELIGRQHFILDGMAEAGFITDGEAELAKQEEPVFKDRLENIIAPHFVMYVREYLTEKYGDVMVEQGGLQVITTLDLFKQEIAEKIITEQAEKNKDAWQASNAALVAIDTKTGQVLSMVGSKDFFDEEIDGQVNVTTRLRQPGSSFKPVVYAAAFRKGYTPQTVLYDVETQFINYDGKDYEPKNYDLEQRGTVTMRKAIQGSLNIPAVKTIYLTGVDNVIDLAEDLGYTSLADRSRFGLSLVLGGGEVQLLEHTNAFATLSREGEWHAIASILEVRDKDGNVLEEFKKVEKKVLETQVARQINNVLSDNEARAFVFGEQNFLSLGGRQVAAKTGTTNDYRDAWTIGYTPSLAVGVWVGNNDNEPMKRGAAGGVVAAPIWHSFMQQILGDTPRESFKEPEPTESEKPVLNGSIAEGVKVKIDKSTGKLATNLTPESMVEEATFQNAHSILHYIDIEDPQGAAGPNHNSDQYTRWEEAILAWAEENEITLEEPPTEFDDVHTSANRPSITITSPSRNQSITSRALTAQVQTSSPRSVSRVEYYLANNRIAKINEPPYSLQVNIQDPRIGAGFFTLRAVVFDDVDNSSSDSVELNFQLPALPSAIEWTSPASGQVLSASDFPVAVAANLTNSENISRIDLSYRLKDGDNNYINTFRQFPGQRLPAQWPQAPDPGEYEIVAQITNKDGFSYESDALEVTVE